MLLYKLNHTKKKQVKSQNIKKKTHKEWLSIAFSVVVCLFLYFGDTIQLTCNLITHPRHFYLRYK